MPQLHGPDVVLRRQEEGILPLLALLGPGETLIGLRPAQVAFRPFGVDVDGGGEGQDGLLVVPLA